MKSINNNSSNAYNNYESYVNRTVASRRKPELKVIEGSVAETKIPSDDDMTLGEKVLMNLLVWVPFVYLAHLTLEHFFG